ncbi:DUF397 domain-containing protein [Streptomyces sp. NRRL F-5681]|nr:DUF397 domain-containing protein [Streptomyces sp. NRRL F-5681]
MNTPELTWIKSTTVHVRDSKQLPTGGPHLGFTPAAWADFVTYASQS